MGPIMLVLASTVMARDAVSLEAVRTGQVGHSEPSVTVHPTVSGQVEVALECGPASFALHTEIQPGQPVTLGLGGLPEGVHTCAGSLQLQAGDGTSGQMPLSLQVQMKPPLSLRVEAAQLDLAGRRLTVHADRPLSKVAVQAIGPAGATAGAGEVGAGDATSVEVEFPGSGEVLTIEVTGWDSDGLPGKLTLQPWSYEIPHEDVVFASGQAVIASEEEPKLVEAWQDLQAVLAKYGDIVEVKLFVAGYTDTVGSESSNVGLSQRRAAAIAGWFRQRGFSGAIAYQGFGEAALAVPTADEVDEAANRRAAYILAAETPPVSTGIPASHWIAL